MKKLAKITSAKLHHKERGILNFWIHVDYEDFGSQGIGGLALDQWDKEKSLFKDFLWGYIKTCFTPSPLLGRIMQNELADPNKEMEQKARLRNTNSTRYHPPLSGTHPSDQVLYPFY